VLKEGKDLRRKRKKKCSQFARKRDRRRTEKNGTRKSRLQRTRLNNKGRGTKKFAKVP